MSKKYFIQVQIKKHGRWSNYDFFDNSHIMGTNFQLEERLDHLKEWLVNQELKEYKLILTYNDFKFIQIIGDKND